MKTKQNDKLTNFYYATQFNNIHINENYYNCYKVSFKNKGWVYDPCKQRNLESMGETIEFSLQKHNNNNDFYLYDIVEMSQEEGLANMTTPKTIGRLYHAGF